MNLIKLASAIYLLLYIAACSLPQQQPSVEDNSDTTSNNHLHQENDNNSIAAINDRVIEQENLVTPSPEPARTEEKAATRAREQAVNKMMARKSKQSMQKRLFTGQTVPANSFAYIQAPSEPTNRENYQHFENNAIKQVKTNPLSTFSIDVDTASYSNVRRIINQGYLPPTDAVRVEEFINYFSYDYAAPDDIKSPFKVTTEVGPSPWSDDRFLLHIALQGYKVPEADRPPVNLIFLIDVSGSMRSTNKLPLLKKSLSFLTNQLRPQDHVAMVVYAGASGLVLPPTPGSEKATIINALEKLQAGGSTNGGAGIKLAYQTAMQNYDKSHSNMILLATDGDFNVGTTNFHQLLDLIKDKRKSGIAISTLGFGAGNYNDHLAEQIADTGNGTAYYIDSLQEARKVMVEQLGSALTPIAKDTKIQIEFNPNLVSEYRLVGYENRHLENHEFNMDSVDAGDLFSGHNVTAIYEIGLVGLSKASIDPLRYSQQTKTAPENHNELAFLKLRYKPVGENKSTLITQSIMKQDIKSTLSHTSSNFQFSATVAAYAQLLRESPYVGNLRLLDLVPMAKRAKGQDENGERSEFINQILLTAELRNDTKTISLRD